MQLGNRKSAIWEGPSLFWTPRGASAAQEQVCKIRHLSCEQVVLQDADPGTHGVGYLGMARGQTAKAEVVEVSGSEVIARFVDPGEDFQAAVAQMIPVMEGREAFVPKRPSRLAAPVRAAADLLERRIERGIDTRQTFFDVADFPWTRGLIERAPEIRAELAGVIETFGTERIKQTADDAGAGKGWRVFPVASLGRRIDFTSAYTPLTASLVEQVPGMIFASYSILLPGQSIPLHRAGSRMNLRFHLGLIVPDGDVGIEIDGVTQRWAEGEAFVFDDRKYHQAWNKTDSPRAILMVDFPRSLPLLERAVSRAYLSLYVNFMNPELPSTKEWRKRVEGHVRPPPARRPQTA